MILTTLSHDFTPRNSALRFGIESESDTPQDVEIEVVDCDNDTTIARQRLRKVTSAEVNIAPYATLPAEHRPTQLVGTSFEELPTAQYTIRTDGVEATPIRISVNRCEVSAPTIVTTMPLNRTIAYGERDELLLMGGVDDHFAAHIESDQGDDLSLDYTSPTGAVRLTISTEDFERNIGSLSVEITHNGEWLTTLHYRVVKARGKSLRLAWISEKGSIERYTFAAIAKAQRKSEKHTITTSNGLQVVSSTSEQLLLLNSRYEPRHITKALAEIISSTKVWIERHNNLHEVEVLTSVIDSNLFGKPDSVRLTLRQWGRKEGSV